VIRSRRSEVREDGLNAGQLGFTLLELLVALVILALGLVTLFGSLGDGSSAAALARHQRDAVAAAETILAELGRSEPLVDGERDGIVGGLHYHLTISPYNEDGVKSLVKAHLVSLDLTWQHDGRTDHTSFETLKLGPGS
jgi:prepilin-type N-terminal cleavage/methylation domain-containing protein